MRAKRRSRSSATSHGNIIDRVFAPLYGLPCWNAKPGYGSSLTFEFGKPHLKIREPRQIGETASEQRKAYHARRHVRVDGQWHLWIHYSDWKAYSDSEFVGDSDTKEGMALATEMLDGQKLLNVIANQPQGHTIFEFDLGGRLVVEPDADYGDEPGDLWLLFEFGGKVLSFREDGMYCYQPGNISPELTRYQALDY